MTDPDNFDSEVDAILATATSSHILESVVPQPASAHLNSVRDLISSLQRFPTKPSLVFRTTPASPVSVIPLTDQPLIVGRSSSCQIALPDTPRLSKIHFSITDSAPDTPPRLRHLSSTNATTINGMACESDRDYSLLDGDAITAGRILFVFLQATGVAD
jgi:hypothetical protein